MSALALAQVLLFDNDNDEDLLSVQEDAAEAMAGAVYDGPLACVRVRAVAHRSTCNSTSTHWLFFIVRKPLLCSPASVPCRLPAFAKWWAA